MGDEAPTTNERRCGFFFKRRRPTNDQFAVQPADSNRGLIDRSRFTMALRRLILRRGPVCRQQCKHRWGQFARHISSDSVLLNRSTSSPGIATVTLNSPRTRNALSLGMLERLGDIVAETSADPDVRVVVVEAAGSDQTGVFCSGHNLKEIMATRTDRAAHENLFRTCSDVMKAITLSPKAFICKVNGLATAAGCQLVASCDLAFASPSSSFGTPGVNIGLFCSTPAVPIVRCIGSRRAMQMLLTGDIIPATKAEAWGLLTEVVAEDVLDTTVHEIAAKIASKSGTAIAIGKPGFHAQAAAGDLDTAYEQASHVMVENMMQPDAEEGITAFLEKRAPHWQ